MFGPAEIVLDIGFGGGEALIELAAARPDEAIMCVEVHTRGVANVLEAIDDNGWIQIRVVEADVLELLPRVPLQSLASVRMFFPDPWPKYKHRNRRLARPDVVMQIVDRLRVGGTWHVATDIEEYAQQVIGAAAGDDRLSGGVVPRPSWRPSTRYEQRGLAAGRTAVDLIFERLH